MLKLTNVSQRSITKDDSWTLEDLDPAAAAAYAHCTTEEQRRAWRIAYLASFWTGASYANDNLAAWEQEQHHANTL